MVVPERRDKPNTRELRLPVVVLQRSKGLPSGSPIVYIAGGPGVPAYIKRPSDIEGWWDWLEYLPRNHDLILFDQRGVGEANPALDCRNLNRVDVWAGLRLTPQKTSPSTQVWRGAVSSCRDKLLAAKHDLSAHNSRESAGDIAALIRLLGREKAILFGQSYGTRVALSVVRYHPGRVGSLILDSVFPPQARDVSELPTHFDRALRIVARDCAIDPACNRLFPDFLGDVARVAKRLRAEPVNLALDLEESARTYFLTLDDVAFFNIIYYALYDPELIALLPFVINATAQEDFKILEILAEVYFFDPYFGERTPAVELSVLCNEEWPFESSLDIEAAAARFPLLANWTRTIMRRRACDLWPSGRAEALENTPVSGEMPVLLLAGAYDPVTPPGLARLAAETLPNSRLFVFPGASHSVASSDRCALDVMAEFLRNPNRPPNPPCLGELKPIDFGNLGME